MLFVRVIFLILFASMVMATKQGGKCRSHSQCECRSSHHYQRICEDHTCRCYPRYNNPSFHFKKDQFCTSSVECECPHGDIYSHKCLNNTCKCTPINNAPSDPSQSGLHCGRRGYCNCPRGHKAGCINEHCMCASNLPGLFCTKIEDCECPEGHSKECIENQCLCSPPPLVNTPPKNSTKDQFCTNSVECECPHDDIYSHKCLKNTCKCTPINNAPSDPSQPGLQCGRRGHCNCPRGHRASCIDKHCVCTSSLPGLFCTKIEDCECLEGHSRECFGNQCLCSLRSPDNTPSSNSTKSQSCTVSSQCQCTEGLFAECTGNECKCSSIYEPSVNKSRMDYGDAIDYEGVPTDMILFTGSPCIKISQCECPESHSRKCINKECACSPLYNTPSDDSQVNNTMTINLSQIANVLKQIKDFFCQLKIPQI